MKNKRLAKANKSQKTAKVVAKKAAAENTAENLKESNLNNKKRKQSQFQQKQADNTMVESVEKNKKSNKPAKRDTNDTVGAKNRTEKGNSGPGALSKQTAVVKPNLQQSYEEAPFHDVQRYLETLPSPEIRNFIEGLIAQDKFNMLTVDVVAAVGDVERMRYYFHKDDTTGKSRYDPNGRCLDGGTPLHAAIKAKHKESVQLLIENGADLSLVDFMGDNAIMAAIKAGDANMINLLWPYKANLDVNHKNTIGKTALHLATERSWEGCVRFLLSNHAIPDALDRDGITPLMLAAGKGDLKVVDILVKAGADICLEDEDYDSSICRALFNDHQQVVDYMINSIDAGRRDLFVKDLICNVMNPPLPDGEYLMSETQFIPLLEECTKHSAFRESFYNQKVVQMIMVKMTKKTKQPDSVIQICCLLMCIFFRFGNEIDTQFVRQFVQSKGTDLVISLVQMYMCEWSFSAKDALQIFLPMIGLVEIPEGRVWLCKNVLDVSEFFNHFEKDLLDVFLTRCEKFEWCSEKKYFKEINRVWIHFYNEVHKMQTEQREKHMTELLQQEEREKDKKEKRLEKIKQKREDKIRKLESSATSDLLESWSAKAIIKEENHEAEESLSTCRNANAIAGLSNEHQKDPAQTTENMASPINTSSQPQADSQFNANAFKWTNPNGGIMFDQFQKVNDEDWTTVQTKKNKEKERQTCEKQNVVRRLPFQNWKGMNPTAQKQKKKKDTKAKTMSLNAFAKPCATSSQGSVRWADIAKGATKLTPHIEADDKSFPKPKADIQYNENGGCKKQKNETIETEFPCLYSQPKQTSKKEKPNKMTFHFHSNQQASCDSDTQLNESEDESIDIEEAEKELQELDEHTNCKTVANVGNISERNARMSQSSECFMYDPEYTDETKPNLFDPTKLTDEEINTMNTRGKIQDGEIRQTKSDSVRFEISNMNASDDSQEDYRNNAPNENITKQEDWMQNVRFFKEDQEDEHLADMTKFIQGGSHNNGQLHSSNSMTGSTQRTTEEGCSDKAQKTKQNNQAPDKVTGTSKTHAKKRKEKKTPAVVSIVNMPPKSDKPKDQREDSPANRMLLETSPVKAFLTDAEAQLLRNQTESFDRFEEQLELHENEHFMELIVSVSPIFEPKPNIIDDLFNTPEEIPEWLEDEEEIPNEEEVWQNMTKHSTPIKQTDETENKHTSHSNHESAEICNDLEQPNVHTVQKHTSPYDLLSADPAIIHCSKRPDYAERSNVDIASTMKKEYEAALFTNQQRNIIPPPIGQNQISAELLRDQSEPNIQGNNTDRESKDPSLNPIGAEKQTAVIKPLGLLSGSPVPATNCAFGQRLLENACRLEDAYDSDDSFLYPGDLAGETYEADDEQQTRLESEDEEFYFPSFHEDTMLSAHYNKEDVSIAHRIQQLQLEQLNNYYSQCKNRITDAASMEQSKFLYYAQSAGMDRDRIQQHLQGTVEIEQRNVHKERNTRPVLPERKEHTINKAENKSQAQESIDQSNSRHMNQASIQDHGQYQNNELLRPDVPQMPVNAQNGQSQGNAPHDNVPPGSIQQPGPLLPLLQFGVIVPFPPPPLHPANIRNIQSQQAAMSSTVRNKIQEILQSMFKSKVKSVRWRNELSRIRNLPPEKLKVIGKIMIPRDDSDIVYIGYHCSGVTILGYLSDGSEVAVKIIDTTFRPLREDEIDKLLSVDSSQLFINRYRAIEEFAGHYYIAMDLHEYSLPEYLKILAQNRNIDVKIAVEKLVFQFLRGILTLHQHYLIVHGELRPGNIVIDIDGNLKVTGYGIGRNTVRASETYAEYNDEDKCWLAPEVLLLKQTIVFKTDIWSIGMLIYYIYKGGKNPFGSEPRQIIQNIVEQNYMMEYISEEAGHLLSMMLSVNKIDRPAIADALKHPMFWAEEKKIRFISIVGSDIVWEMKNNYMTDKKMQRENSMTTIVSMAPCNITLIRWIQAIEPIVMKEMKAFRQYKNSIVELVVFVYNCCNHFETLAPKVKEIIDEPCIYFLNKFPTLFMTVYRVIKFSNKRDKTCYKPFF